MYCNIRNWKVITLIKIDIWLIELSSGQHFDLMPDGGDFKSFTWSPEGNKLAYVGTKLANDKIEMGIISLDLGTKSVIEQQTILIRNQRKYVSPITWSKADIWYFIDWQENISTVNAARMAWRGTCKLCDCFSC